MPLNNFGHHENVILTRRKVDLHTHQRWPAWEEAAWPLRETVTDCIPVVYFSCSAGSQRKTVEEQRPPLWQLVHWGTFSSQMGIWVSVEELGMIFRGKHWREAAWARAEVEPGPALDQRDPGWYVCIPDPCFEQATWKQHDHAILREGEVKIKVEEESSICSRVTFACREDRAQDSSEGGQGPGFQWRNSRKIQTGGYSSFKRLRKGDQGCLKGQGSPFLPSRSPCKYKSPAYRNMEDASSPSFPLVSHVLHTS